ncbi:hypothetical protein DSECCO2_51250 [anaerobic digester metagenome]|jgi:hypothetical protein
MICTPCPGGSPTSREGRPLPKWAQENPMYQKISHIRSLNEMDEVITGCVNPLFMGPTVKLDLTTILQATGELQHFLDLGAARLRAEGPLPEEASEELIFTMADELEDHLRAMRDRRGSASINDLQGWTQAWIDEQQEALARKPSQGGDRG